MICLVEIKKRVLVFNQTYSKNMEKTILLALLFLNGIIDFKSQDPSQGFKTLGRDNLGHENGSAT